MMHSYANIYKFKRHFATPQEPQIMHGWLN